MKTRFTKTRAFRYGAAATAFTCVFIAVVVIFNVIFSALAEKYLWYVDMTEEEVFSLSAATYDLMADVDEEITIYFASEPDEIMNGSASSYMKYIYATALQLADAFPNVSVECKDVVKNRAFFERFRQTDATKIYTTSVIVEAEREFRVFESAAFFISNADGEVWAYQGEYSMISAILQLTSAELPIVYFTTEHGENMSESASPLITLFHDSGFDVRPINLASDEIDPDTRIIIVNDPSYDFIGAEADSPESNEIAKLDRYLDGLGTLMVFVSPDKAENLPNLREFLEEWGIGLTPNTYIRDTQNAISTDAQSIVAKYDADTLGASLYRDLTANLSTLPKTIFRYTMPLEILYTEGGSLSGAREVSPVLTSYASAEAIRDGEVIGTDEYVLMAVSRETQIMNDDYYYSNVIVIGSANFADSRYLLSSAYANDDILSATMKATGRDKILAEIDFKVFDNTELDITTAEANRASLVILLVLPTLSALCGVVVWVRRKNA